MTKKREKALTTGQMAQDLLGISSLTEGLALVDMNTKMAISLRFVLLFCLMHVLFNDSLI